MGKLLTAAIFVLSLLFAGHAFGKSNEYYQQTLIQILTECNSKCQEQVFGQEASKAFLVLMDTILNQLRFELSQQKKEKLWSKSY